LAGTAGGIDGTTGRDRHRGIAWPRSCDGFRARARRSRCPAAVGHIDTDIAQVEAVTASANFSGRVLTLVADLRRPADCDRVVAMARERLGTAQILVNNAGLTFTTIDPARFRRNEPQKFWQVADEIVDTMNRPHTAPYGASKAALEMATEVWAKEVEGTGLTINIVNPGAGANTPGMADEMRAMSREGRAPRLVEPEEMVPPLLYVVSRDADTVNGWRFDANLWDASLPPREAARRAGRPAGFEMHPRSA
jgi:NAD(P)-dependent dehydrogenase (short-subunit alcohol dehydrogenase family)